MQGNAPAFTVTSITAVNDEPGVGMRIEGTFQVPCYLDSPGCEPGGGFSYASRRSNIPVRSDTAQLPHRALLLQRAVGGLARRTARSTCSTGTACSASGDQVFSESDIQRMAERHNAMYCATDWTGMNVPSVPFAVEVLKNLSLFPKFADRLQQGLVDQLYLGQADAAPERPRVRAGVPAGRPADLRQLEAALRLEQPGRDHGRRADGARARLPERRARRAGDQLLDPAAAQRRLRQPTRRSCTTSTRTSASGRSSSA